MRLIDADKLKAHYAWWGNDGAEYRERKADFDVIVDLQPTVDAKPIVRCKDCKHGTEADYKDIYFCNLGNGIHDDAFYCANAERSDETVETYTINAGEV